MRILIGSESFPPVLSGVSIVTERLAHELVERGHEVVVVTGSADRRFHSRKTHGYVVKWLPTVPNPFRRGLRFTVRARHRLGGIVDDFKPDVIHIHDPGKLCHSLVNEGEEGKIPVVVTHHFMIEGLLPYLSWLKPAHPLVGGMLERVLVKLYNRCSTIVVPTETMRAYLDHWDQLEAPRRVISNGVDLARFTVPGPEEKKKARKLWSLPEDRIIFGYAGRIDPEKNVPLLLKAVAALPVSERPYVAIAGRGNVAEECKELAVELGVTDISWGDPVQYTDPKMVAFYHALDVFCLPTQIETESMSCMEAMACGLPVIASDVGALPELVDASSGVLIPFNDEEGWKAAIRELTADTALRTAKGAIGEHKIYGRSLDAAIGEIEQLYVELVS